MYTSTATFSTVYLKVEALCTLRFWYGASSYMFQCKTYLVHLCVRVKNGKRTACLSKLHTTKKLEAVSVPRTPTKDILSPLGDVVTDTNSELKKSGDARKKWKPQQTRRTSNVHNNDSKVVASDSNEDRRSASAFAVVRTVPCGR